MLGVFSRKRAARLAFRIFCTPFRKVKKKPPPIFARAEAISFSFNGYTIRGYRWNKDAPVKLLVLHGFESSVLNFDRYIALFVKKGYEVLAFDAPAHGRSEGRQITLPLYTAMITEINLRYGPIQRFMAHSLGGLALIHFLEAQGGGGDRKAVLLAPATETVTAIDAFFQILDIHPAIRPFFDQFIHDISGEWPGHYSIRRAMHHVRANILWFHDEEDDLTPFADAEKVKK